MKNFRFPLLFVSILWMSSQFALADKYPKNPHIDVLHYAFDLSLSDDKDEISAVAVLTFLCKKEGLEKFRLDLVNQSDSLHGKGMTIESVYEQNQKLEFKHVNNEVWITFSKKSTANSQMQITIRYHGIPADGLRIGPTKYGDRSFFNENWPNRARHWLPVIDHPYDKATSEFTVRAPSHYQVISNGLLIEETNLDSKTKLTHWKQSIPVSSWLFVLGVAEFAVQYVGQFDGKSIQTWVYPKDRDAGFFDFAEPTKQVVGFFSDYIGPYVYEKIANVQTPSVKGGMETSSAIFYWEDLVDGKRTTRLRNVLIHELAHQWFGNAVTESSWDDAWLSEGFATYFTMLFIEHAYGRDELVSQLNASRTSALNFATKEPSYKIIYDRSPEKMPVTSTLTYQKGAWVLHMLRSRIGDRAFQQGIREYYNRFMNGNASTDDFRQAMEKASGMDLKNFFQQWLYQGGQISLKGFWKYDETSKLIKISIQQMQPKEFTFDFSLEVGVLRHGKELPDISSHQFSSAMLEFTLPAETKPERVVLDPRTVLLASWEFVETH